MNLHDPKQLRTAILEATLAYVDGRNDGLPWFPRHYVTQFGIPANDESVRLVTREIKYLADKGQIKAVGAAGTFAVTAITAAGRDFLDGAQVSPVEGLASPAAAPALALPKLFLGYAFALDYVRPTVERAADGLARVIVASDELRGQPLLHKIESMMAAADLCLFDLTIHNPNVAAELGIAHAKRYKYAILYSTSEQLNPHPGRESSLFSDLRGWDALLYTDAAELETKLRRFLPGLLASEAPTVPAPLDATEAGREARDRAFAVRPLLYMVLGSGEGGPQGNYINGFVRNVGRGIAREPRLFLPGFGDVATGHHLIKQMEDISLRFRYDDKPFYTELLPETEARIEFEDEIGNKYEQMGTVTQGRSATSNVLSYGIENLGISQTCRKGFGVNDASRVRPRQLPRYAAEVISECGGNPRR